MSIDTSQSPRSSEGVWDLPHQGTDIYSLEAGRGSRHTAWEIADTVSLSCSLSAAGAGSNEGHQDLEGPPGPRLQTTQTAGCRVLVDAKKEKMEKYIASSQCLLARKPSDMLDIFCLKRSYVSPCRLTCKCVIPTELLVISTYLGGCVTATLVKAHIHLHSWSSPTMHWSQ